MITSPSLVFYTAIKPTNQQEVIMPLFEIVHYKVSSYLRRSDLPGRVVPQFERVLEMTGPTLYHGIRNKATFAFASTFNSFTEPIAGFVQSERTGGLFVVGWFPVAEFTYYYDILRSERPVSVLYEVRERGASTGYLGKVGLGTSTEPIGEGPSDSTEELSAVMAAHLSPHRGLFVPMPVAEFQSTQEQQP
jgi:hypothetical protein